MNGVMVVMDEAGSFDDLLTDAVRNGIDPKDARLVGMESPAGELSNWPEGDVDILGALRDDLSHRIWADALARYHRQAGHLPAGTPVRFYYDQPAQPPTDRDTIAHAADRHGFPRVTVSHGYRR